MFEKSLYDLIKGLRSHRGAEDEYIQNSLRECKIEVKSQDMDKKATAVLKLIYLEMFGYDMSWASFHVLEVMSSPKFLQKRVGYLGAAQSFRPDTDVLMLATNLLKKDITSSNLSNVSLPLTTLPHVTSPSLTMSLLPDILARLSHAHAIIRKKAVVSLYRLSLVYPDALKLAWPRIKDRLMDDNEDGSVTTAVINVVCELGWRRPRDFLPLAPRFFDLLVDGGNNWMAIKIIKLFATLTSVEPRLVRKLLRPLANIIETTTAMSLLYECINGIIQGGILDGDEDPQEKDEIAGLCVGKLRGMIVMDADPNLKYVALLAFNRIVISHPALVSMHQDVIMDCLEDEDISIRFQALELVAGIITSDALQSVVNRLVGQLRGVSSSTSDFEVAGSLGMSGLIGDDELEEPAGSQSQRKSRLPPLPSDYRVEVLHRIIDLCSHNNYSELTDFEWYIDILVQLVALLPRSSLQSEVYAKITNDFEEDISSRIGSEIRNIAVRVKGIRIEATRAAESLVLIKNTKSLISDTGDGVLGPAAWVVGEYAEFLAQPERTLWSLVDITNASLPAKTLSLYLQAIPKVFSHLTCSSKFEETENGPRKSEVSLLLVRIIGFFETLAVHPDLDVQERSVEFLEILRLAAEALHLEASGTGMPPLLFSVIPSLFSGLELNPVATSAQRKVPLPDKLILDRVLNVNLVELFDDRDGSPQVLKEQKSFYDYYYSRDTPVLHGQSIGVGQSDVQVDKSYENVQGGSTDEFVAMVRRGAERRDRNRDDPFYIDTEGSSNKSTPFHRVFDSSNGNGLDVDSIPIIDLAVNEEKRPPAGFETKKAQPRSKKIDIAVDETIEGHDSREMPTVSRSIGSDRAKASLLQVDSSSLGQLSLGNETNTTPENHTNDDVDMAKAMQEVEKARLGMQRASERIDLQGTPAEGAPVKKKKKKDGKKRITAPSNASEGSRKPSKKSGVKQNTGEMKGAALSQQ